MPERLIDPKKVTFPIPVADAKIIIDDMTRSESWRVIDRDITAVPILFWGIGSCTSGKFSMSENSWRLRGNESF